MTAFAPLLGLLDEVPDRRRAESKLYRLPHVLLFSILAIVSGGNSYRSVTTFIDAHLHAGLRQCAAHRVRQAADADLQAVAVLDLGGDQAGDGQFDIRRESLGKLGGGAAIAVDHEIHIALMHGVLLPVAPGQAWIDLKDDDPRLT